LVDLKELQKAVMQNRKEKGFQNDVVHDFGRAYEELSEASLNTVRPRWGGGGICDVIIFIMGMCDQLDF